MSTRIQQTAEAIFIKAMNGGDLSGIVFRHSDNALRSKKQSISVKAGAPVPQLEGFRGHRVEVEIEIKPDKPSIGEKFHAVALERITTAETVRRAALSAGMTTDDDLFIVDEEISGDRVETKNLRKRNITIPILLRIS
jgi:hypothetical protein